MASLQLLSYMANPLENDRLQGGLLLLDVVQARERDRRAVLAEPLEQVRRVFDQHRCDVPDLGAEMKDESDACLVPQVSGREVFSGAEARRVPLDALGNRGVRAEDDPARGADGQHEPGPRGDPLNSARLSVSVTAHFVANSDPARTPLRDLWLRDHPKSKLYVDFADFSFVRFEIIGASLNGGFGRAYRLTATDLI